MANNDEILYAYDPLCGWCYGFSPVIKALHDQFHDRVEFTVLSGGMVIGDRAGIIRQKAPYIEWAYKDVEEATGIKFGEAFFSKLFFNDKAVFNSEKPSVAMSVFKHALPAKAVEFSGVLQRAIYVDGIDLQDDNAYPALVKPFGLDGNKFVEDMNSAEMKEFTWSEFAVVNQLGVRGFPTVFYRKGDQLTQLSRGFRDLESMKVLVERLLEMPELKW